ncbi:aldo/keto reductase [Galactobacter sp.]|uniref:aldo/keto reductase n=1 Tax=Galactobacter sp. TaxID=2676125 RepID=UPI0025BC8AC5|nr:aldo/keto reductase [Galactobacter sp.]
MSLTTHRGFTLPSIGLGTYKLRGAAGAEAIANGINSGYTLLDSAYNYENEGTVGEGLRASASGRGNVIVTSKLPGRYQRHDDALTCVQESLYRLNLENIDLYLIHWPNPGQGLYVEAFKALLEARESGLISHVGVCNFLPEHLEAVHDATGEYPEVNQIELNPYFPQTEALAYNSERGIVTQAWSPLRRGGELFSEPVITSAAERLGVSAAEIVLAWHAAIGSLPIPKSATPARQLANLAAVNLELTSDEVAAITALGRPDGRLKDQDPAVYEEF